MDSSPYEEMCLNKPSVRGLGQQPSAASGWLDTQEENICEDEGLSCRGSC